MRRRRKRATQPNTERWLVSYADFITLLFAFFVVMYSTAQVDQRRIGKLALAIQVAFQEMGVFPASTTKVPVNEQQPMPFSAVQIIDSAKRTTQLGRVVAPAQGMPANEQENGDLSGLRRELEQTLAPEIARHEVALRAVPDGLVVSLREIGFFESGSAALKTDSQSAFGRIARILANRPYRIRVEGHTDTVPIHNAKFASNWELSTARASEVVRLLIVGFGFAPERLSAAGYAQYHPIADNGSAAGRAQNRRVDIVILGKLPPDRAPGAETEAGLPPATRP